MTKVIDEVLIQPTGRRPSTVLEEFDRLRQQRMAEWFEKWKGKIHLDIDVDELRGRRRTVNEGLKRDRDGV
jgi:hypothetical protein